MTDRYPLVDLNEIDRACERYKQRIQACERCNESIQACEQLSLEEMLRSSPRSIAWSFETIAHSRKSSSFSQSSNERRTQKQ